MSRAHLAEQVRRRWPLAAASLLVPILGITFIGVGGTDDAYITFSAARQLIETGSVLNHNGDRIEQSSSLLHVLVLALTGWITHLPLPWVAWGIGIVAAMATVVVAGLLADRVRPGTALAASVLTALTTPFLYWSVGSLETPLAALLLATTAFTTVGALRSTETGGIRRSIAPAISITLFTMVRPEGGALLLLAFGLAFLVLRRLERQEPERRRRSSIRLVQFAAVAAAASITLALGRLMYFGRAVPQPVWAKSGISVGRLAAGLTYLVRSVDASVAVLFVLAFLGLWSLRHRWSEEAALVGAFLLASLLVTAGAGGDWMPFGRFLVVSLPLLAVFAAIGFRTVGHRVIAGAAVASLMLIGGAFHLSADSEGSPIWTTPVWTDSGTPTVAMPWIESHSRGHIADVTAAPRLAAIVDALAASEEPPVTVSSMQAGALIFHAQKQATTPFRFIDTLSLTTDDLTHCPKDGNHTKRGYAVGLSSWFAGEPICGVAPPDVLLLLYCEPIETESSHYTIVWRTGGSFDAGPLHTRGVTDQCIAVRDDLVDSLPADLRAPAM